MAKKTAPNLMSGAVDCACVIHGDKYSWIYVERLQAMVRRSIKNPVNFHVFTEHNREVPDTMIKHSLVDWPGVSGPKKSWWYKMQIFDPANMSGPVLYLDLDVVIIDSLDWILGLDPMYFWAIRDWRHIYKPLHRGMNSSVMFWDNSRFQKIWQEFSVQGINEVVKKYRGDQDFLDSVITTREQRFFPDESMVSWRWQIKDGGLDPKTHTYRRPGQGSILTPGAKILVFHGTPKPHETQDALIEEFWNQ